MVKVGTATADRVDDEDAYGNADLRGFSFLYCEIMRANSVIYLI